MKRGEIGGLLQHIMLNPTEGLEGRSGNQQGLGHGYGSKPVQDHAARYTYCLLHERLQYYLAAADASIEVFG